MDALVHLRDGLLDGHILIEINQNKIIPLKASFIILLNASKLAPAIREVCSWPRSGQLPWERSANHHQSGFMSRYRPGWIFSILDYSRDWNNWGLAYRAEKYVKVTRKWSAWLMIESPARNRFEIVVSKKWDLILGQWMMAVFLVFL